MCFGLLLNVALYNIPSKYELVPFSWEVRQSTMNVYCIVVATIIEKRHIIVRFMDQNIYCFHQHFMVVSNILLVATTTNIANTTIIITILWHFSFVGATTMSLLCMFIVKR